MVRTSFARGGAGDRTRMTMIRERRSPPPLGRGNPGGTAAACAPILSPEQTPKELRCKGKKLMSPPKTL